MRRGDGRMGADNRAWCLRTTTVLSCYRKWVRIPVYVEEEQFHLNRPRSIYKYSNMAPRRSDQNCKLNFLSCFCLLIIPRRGLDTKKTPPNIDVCPESLGANIKKLFQKKSEIRPRHCIASTCLRSRKRDPVYFCCPCQHWIKIEQTIHTGNFENFAVRIENAVIEVEFLIRILFAIISFFMKHSDASKESLDGVNWQLTNSLEFNWQLTFVEGFTDNGQKILLP